VDSDSRFWLQIRFHRKARAARHRRGSPPTSRPCWAPRW